MIRPASRGFSLIEMLLVLVIIGIVAALVVPAADTVIRGMRLTQATQTVMDQLAIARQAAIGKNRIVEVRFYQFADPETPSSTVSFRAMQSLEMINSRGLAPLNNVIFLPVSTIMDAAPTLSSLLDPSARTLCSGTDSLPRVGTNYHYIAVRFRPDGSTDLLPTGGPWFLTIHAEVSGDSLSRPPANFSTVEIDPVNGDLKVFRP